MPDLQVLRVLRMELREIACSDLPYPRPGVPRLNLFFLDACVAGQLSQIPALQAACLTV